MRAEFGFIELLNMTAFSITTNPQAEDAYFDWLLKRDYPTYDGFSRNNAAYIELYFTDVLSQAQKNTITATYNALTENELIVNKQCKIYADLPVHIVASSDKTVPPFDIDYGRTPLTRLSPVITDVFKGEVREITYYRSVSFNAYGQLVGSDPILIERFVYVRDVAKMAVSRTMTIHWLLNDDTEHPEYKERLKLYSPEAKIAEGQRLRKNIIDFCQPNVLAMIMQTEQVDYDTAVTLGAQLSNKYASQMSSWITSSRGNTLLSLLEADDEILWLDNVIDGEGNTIRGHLLNQLNY
jgi:hypothetical protein